MEPYTVALTSCGRFDLLERTLGSLLPRLDGPLAEILIAEDSGDARVHDVVRQFGDAYGRIDVILNDPPLGQIKSIDRLYSRVGTEWIFHCEDDWEFFGDGFIEKSFAILEEFDHYSMVHLRDPAELTPHYFFPEAVASSGVRYRAVNPAVAPVFSGLSFNPGLRRMRDYRIVGPYAGLRFPSNEFQVAWSYRQLGYLLACLAEPAVRHIGNERHVRDQAKPPDFASTLSRSIRKRWFRLRRTLSPERDPIVQARRRMEQAGLSFPPSGDRGA
ncbi:MAG: glycosyltransferase family 2 protein [Rhodospirillaceae bacterium]|nr:glycosyltransferase family 2 protein [Rhodospirillaceae bacterium]MYB12694.1 glycosyltransferase family 2 protein [Rhodospirillaceae bacterium]MYI49405.1 glycosyltransferase family 2 protein [Rhodospirillaceae bacterium]